MDDKQDFDEQLKNLLRAMASEGIHNAARACPVW